MQGCILRVQYLPGTISWIRRGFECLPLVLIWRLPPWKVSVWMSNETCCSAQAVPWLIMFPNTCNRKAALHEQLPSSHAEMNREAQPTSSLRLFFAGSWMQVIMEKVSSSRIIMTSSKILQFRSSTWITERPACAKWCKVRHCAIENLGWKLNSKYKKAKCLRHSDNFCGRRCVSKTSL